MMPATATTQLTDEVVFDYWEQKAAQSGDSPTATIRDLHYLQLETDTISRYLRPSDTVIDIGCGNGSTTLRFAEQVNRIVGVDYSPGMIDAAAGQLEYAPAGVASRVSFQVGDARALRFPDESFSRVIMQRCLINIPDRTQQVAAVAEAARVLRTGELMLLAEVTLQGHEQVNKYRTRFGLDRLKVHWHNTYVDEPTFLEAISDTLELQETIRFGMYGLLSKVVHPLLVHPHEPMFDAPLNEVAARIAREMPEFERCSHHVLFVFKK